MLGFSVLDSCAASHIVSIMPPKLKTTRKPAKAIATKPVAKAKPATKKAVTKARTKAKKATVDAIQSAKPPARKVAAKAKTIKKETQGVFESVKKGMQTGMDAVGDLMKRITPDALKSKPAKPRRK